MLVSGAGAQVGGDSNRLEGWPHRRGLARWPAAEKIFIYHRMQCYSGIWFTVRHLNHRTSQTS